MHSLDKFGRIYGGALRSMCNEQRAARARLKRALPVKEKLCPTCNQAFRPRRICQRYCSLRCQSRASSTRRFPRQDRKITCAKCHEEFISNKPWAKFCSSNCSDKSRRPPKGTHVPEQRIYATCKYCQKDFSQPRKSYRTTIKNRDPKYCSLKCTYADRRGEASRLHRGVHYGNRGSGWARIAAEIRSRDSKCCVICSQPQGEKRFHVDHIVPYRLMVQWGLEPNNEINLATLCTADHGRKTMAESKLLCGDVLGFNRTLVAIGYPVNMVRAALEFAELTTKGLP